MSRTVWNVLGVACIGAALLLWTSTQERLLEIPPDQQHVLLWGTVGFMILCTILAIACFFPKSHPITIRFIGLLGVAGCLFSLYEMFHSSSIAWVTSILRSVVILGVWLPGSLYLVVKGKITGG